ncbi:MAG: biofilm regulation phosphoprotein SiaC [Alphaproteobacteria bacterium]|uniref:Biofilm regulation phosphoprotein SiaC n=1 Tax=Candidatus Nitrobium versatile TaxID=2884831 RepID=A0A953LWT9_9BACT|nr:biofilm regulation phosphoprotein SiaC [Candidatus Nitrobium versatile]
MKNLYFEATQSTPRIHFDASTGVLEMSGESYPENSFAFFAPVMAWIREYLSRTSGPVEARINVSYLNTSSTKCVIDMLDCLEEAFRSGRNVSVNWYYDGENDRAADTAEEFREDLTMPFTIIAVRE